MLGGSVDEVLAARGGSWALYSVLQANYDITVFSDGLCKPAIQWPRPIRE